MRILRGPGRSAACDCARRGASEAAAAAAAGEGTLLSLERCGPHVAISLAMLRSSNRSSRGSRGARTRSREHPSPPQISRVPTAREAAASLQVGTTPY